MAKNQAFPGPGTARRFCLVPSTVLGGDLIIVGSIPGVALTDYKANTALGNGCVVDFGGSHVLSVTAKSSLSPSVGSAVKPGDKLYLDGGTLDSTTNVTTGGTIDKNTGGTFIGYLDPSYTAGILTTVTDANALVKLGGME